MFQSEWLPVVFAFLAAFAVYAYTILDGYDLGVGILMPMGEAARPERDLMISTIGPFWDANETWLVLAVGILLIAFPPAYSAILYHLYIPAALMLICLIIRGVAFDFRTKASEDFHRHWDRAFKYGSLGVAVCQGYMLGRFVTAFESGPGQFLFCVISAFGVASAYTMIGAGWLVIKTEGDLQRLAIQHGKIASLLTATGVILVSVVNPWVNASVWQRWQDYLETPYMYAVPAFCGVLFVLVYAYYARGPFKDDRYCWIPFIGTAAIFLLCFFGLAVSFYPYVVPWDISIWEAASATESLRFLFIGTIVVVPMILLYTLFVYRVFRGKSRSLEY